MSFTPRRYRKKPSQSQSGNDKRERQKRIAKPENNRAWVRCDLFNLSAFIAALGKLPRGFLCGSGDMKKINSRIVASLSAIGCQFGELTSTDIARMKLTH